MANSFDNSHADNAYVARYREAGFCLFEQPILPETLLANAVDRIEPVCRGEYDLGREPWRCWNLGDPYRIQKVDQVHQCDSAFLALATSPVIGEIASELCGGARVQLWASQLLIKPANSGAVGNVGWHTDRQNWPFWSGELLTAWIPLSATSSNNGALQFIPGSHHWSTALEPGDPYEQSMELLQQRYQSQLEVAADWREVWREVPAELHRGGLSFHHWQTVHGSHANRSDQPRIALALHLRTETSAPLPGVNDFGLCQDLDNHSLCPYYR